MKGGGPGLEKYEKAALEALIEKRISNGRVSKEVKWKEIFPRTTREALQNRSLGNECLIVGALD